ncbi:hypothetical protein [Demequina lutea]|uniref:Putative membrane protein n=1 Tax=Demequina lutea TaxID=431489 RepID=A0A7Y9Z8G4_9MICO|nr:hypothetical protein [Demequina lutea]NYI40714.1 putative membrane protein [Demequina lutea]
MPKNEPELTSRHVAVAVLAATVVLVSLAGFVSARVAILSLAAFALAGAAARAFAPLGRAFVVRSKLVDVVVLVVLGGVLLFLGLTTPLG